MVQSLLFLVIGVAIGYLLPRANKTTATQASGDKNTTTSSVTASESSGQNISNDKQDNKRVIAAITAAIAYHTQG
ncbi:MAG: OadG family transporter subunit [Sulfuricurvum sp.]